MPSDKDNSTIETENETFLQNLDKPREKVRLLVNGSVPWAQRTAPGVTHNTFYIPPSGKHLHTH